MKSGLVVLSNAVKYCYPFVESIKSFLPVVDEVVAAFDISTSDNTEEVLRREVPNVRIVRFPFLLESLGRIAYGLIRTHGYQACKGDVIVMFDADGVLHEKDVPTVNEYCERMMKENFQYGYWEKHRIYKPDTYLVQHKHKGVLNKRRLGDNLDFFGTSGADSLEVRNEIKDAAVNSGVTLFGYEHLWDTLEVILAKTTRYGKMLDRIRKVKPRTTEEYFTEYVSELKSEIKKRGQRMEMGRHPAIMKDRLAAIDEKCFGYNFFEGYNAG